MGRTSSKPEGYRKSKVIMVELKIAMPNTPQITFFSSKKAVFEYFGNEALRLTYKSASTHNWEKTPYENTVCRIVQGLLFPNECPEIQARREEEGRQPIPTRGSFTKKPE